MREDKGLRQAVRRFLLLYRQGETAQGTLSPRLIRLYIRVLMGSAAFIVVVLGICIYQFLALQQARQDLELAGQQRELVTQRLDGLQKKMQTMDALSRELRQMAKGQGGDALPKIDGSRTEKNRAATIRSDTSYNELAPAAGRLEIHMNARIIEFIALKKVFTAGVGGAATAPSYSVYKDCTVPSLWPVKGPVTSPFGPRICPTAGASSFHEGVDIGVPVGTPVHAAATGNITVAAWIAGYGNLVEIAHGQGYSTRYAHNSLLLVVAGQHVQAGDIIALSGNTGRTTGPHVHYEVRIQGKPVDPMLFLP
ncbi:peptidase, M23 family [Veillonellaceae bacterium DNF00751]|uniref:Peptidase, M23 family n=1 Tax=Megasphaera lornae TaxID=1000568 RepID=A0ABP2L632_9FIRM|nr:M23 family metallopeptidase [Megasphaera lornae]EGL42216.1 peptidase, M23 family [Megasphaera lornae]KXB91451.1 peptidase, M23 family [Veillonellaceae bacterium DNF00751]